MTDEDQLRIGQLTSAQRYRDAFEVALPFAEAGDSAAQSIVGWLLAYGFLTEGDVDTLATIGPEAREEYFARLRADEHRGAEWLAKASQAGFGVASHNLAMLYAGQWDSGLSIEEAKQRAKELLKLAHEQGVRFADISTIPSSEDNLR